jgi:Family of unknown function (DUF5686)/CarboxypepD_reg-like domain
MFKKRHLLILLFGLSIQAQNHVSGIVKDSKTKDVLPFASIIFKNNRGLLTDANGLFNFTSKYKIDTLIISYVGYKTKTIIYKKKKFIEILLSPSVEQLQTVILNAPENPAIALIKKVIKNKPKNNYKKILNTYKYISYNKLLVTGSPDSIDESIDSVYRIKEGKKTFVKLDSSNYELKSELKKHHLYLTEKISEHLFQKGRSAKEKVLAARMAGLKNPLYEILALDLQSFDFYNDKFEVVGNRFKSPLSNKALKHYNYKILDTLNNNFLVYFKPLKTNQKAGLEGILYIDTKTYALTKGLAQLKGVLAVKANQIFSYQPKFKLWFPTETSVKINKGDNDKTIALFGGIIAKSGSSKQQKDSMVYTSTVKRKPEDIIYFSTITKNFDLQLNIPLKVKNASQTIVFTDDVATRSNTFWQKFRTDSITKRGLETYRFIDSIGKAEKFEHYINLSRKIFKGYYPVKNFDFNLSQLINFNNHEGLRLGGGFTTNTDFSKNFKIKAYTAYGLKDNTVKYHLSAYARLAKQKNIWFGLGYTDDISEAAKLDFLFEDTSFSLINPRNLNIGQFFNYKTTQAYLNFDIKSNLETRIQFSTGAYETKFNYLFISPTRFLSDYNLSLASIALQWTPFSTYMNTPIGKIRAKNGQLKIIAQLTQSFDKVLNGDFNFTQFNFKIAHKISALDKSTTSFLIQGGLVFGEVPISHLYNAFPNYALKNPWQKRINLSGINAFETMTFNEFISDKYISFQVRQVFGRLKITSKFRPQINVVSRFAIGTIDNPQYQRGFGFKKMEKGYFESGLEVNKFLLKGFGFSFFYRYGAYSNPKFEDNLAIKLNYHFGLNF